MTKRDVRILLATYEGEPYLREQLDSIRDQTYEEWTLVANDDGSRDGTVAILDAYAAADPGRFRRVASGPRQGGAKENFGYLMREHGDADYLFFSDQDDVWDPAKVSELLAEMRRLERRHGAEMPILVHSDVALIAPDGDLVHPSMSRAQKLQPETRRELRHLLVQNNVTGCTVAINRSLRDLASPVPAEAIMHDWWLALVAAAFGVVGYLPRPLVGYRQHGANAVGAKPYSWTTVARQARELGEARAALKRTFGQAGAFRDRYGDALAPRQRELLDAYLRLPRTDPWTRRRLLVRHGFWKAGAARNVGLLLLV